MLCRCLLPVCCVETLSSSLRDVEPSTAQCGGGGFSIVGTLKSYRQQSSLFRGFVRDFILLQGSGRKLCVENDTWSRYSCDRLSWEKEGICSKGSGVTEDVAEGAWLSGWFLIPGSSGIQNKARRGKANGAFQAVGAPRRWGPGEPVLLPHDIR